MSKLQDKFSKGSGNRKPITPEAKRQAYMLVINSLLLTVVYFSAMGINQPIIGTAITVAYWVTFAGFLLSYIIYNRAFSRKNITEEMLPDTMTAEEKEEYIADGKRRLEKSKWMLSVIIPLLVTIALDAIYLFTWPMVQTLLNL
jgi:hypothetical protein